MNYVNKNSLAVSVHIKRFVYMSTKKLCFAGTVLILLSQGVLADDYKSAAKLLEDCKSFNPLSRAECKGYISGAFDRSEGRGVANTPYCVPEGVLDTQLIKIVVKHLNEYPELLHYRASTLVADAFVGAFPCE
jgi:hypothetical protein